jgi:prephenate dehydrogenase
MNRIANLHNFVPESVDPEDIGIIGGKRGMGQLLAREFMADGYKVTVTGEDPARGSSGRALQRLNRAVIRNSDVVILAIPLEKLSADIQEVLGSNPGRGLRCKAVLDVGSLKVEPLRQLCKLKGPSIIGLHPMFSPMVTDFKNLNVVIIPALQPSAAGSPVMRLRLDRWVDWMERFWRKRGATVQYMSAAMHDRLVPPVQFEVLASIMCYAEGLRTAKISLKEMQKISTPNSRLLTATMARMLTKEMAPTYTNIAFENKVNVQALETIAASALHFLDLLRRGDRVAFQESFMRLGDWLRGKQGDDLRSTAAFVQRALANRGFIEEALQRKIQLTDRMAVAAPSVGNDGKAA